MDDAFYGVGLMGDGPDIAVVVSLARNALADVEEYVQQRPETIGRILHFVAAGGHGPAAVAGGAHAAAFADQVADKINDVRLRGSAKVHLFMAAPNAVTFLLGQHREAIGNVVLTSSILPAPRPTTPPSA